MERITLTGADERTDIDQLVELVNRFPAVEVGLLYTATPEGRPRYPSRDWLLTAAAKLSEHVAIHVCGRTARLQMLNDELHDLTRHAPRVQVNGVLSVDELVGCAGKVSTLITQHTAANTALVEVQLPNHALLIDGSGGRGISPEAWLPPKTHKPVGFAGGMGPDNIVAELMRIEPVAKYNAWVDMEGKLRVDDWFDFRLANACAEQFDAFRAGARLLPPGVSPLDGVAIGAQPQRRLRP
jgi:hypothetical protein